jgi:hypothetical protein
VLPGATYCDFGPPSLRFRLRLASASALLPARQAGTTSRGDELARQVGKTVPKFEVGQDEVVKKTSKTPITMLMFNDLKLGLQADIV